MTSRGPVRQFGWSSTAVQCTEGLSIRKPLMTDAVPELLLYVLLLLWEQKRGMYLQSFRNPQQNLWCLS